MVKSEFEVILGSDNFIRINVDGACLYRARLGEGCICRFVLSDGTRLEKIIEELDNDD